MEYHGSIAIGKVPSSSMGLATKMGHCTLELEYGHHLNYSRLVDTLPSLSGKEGKVLTMSD